METLMKTNLKTVLASTLIAVMTFGSLGFSSDADARKRFGGGQSSGMQRDSVKRDAGTPPKPATPPQAAPAGAAAAAPAAAATAAPAASGMRKWLGPLAGLAVGGLLASMLMGSGFDGLKILDMLLMAGIAIGGFMLIRAFMRKRAMSAADGKGSNSMQYAGAGAAYNPSQPAPVESQRAAYVPPAQSQDTGRMVAPEIGSRLADGNASSAQIEAATLNPRIPADFDVVPFERQAEAAFIRLQAANDAKDLNDIRDFTSPEMFAEISLQLKDRGDAVQRTEVVTLSVNVLEVVNENNRAIASVRYTGTIREDVGALPESFDEVWHVAKNLNDADATWKLAGIQQLS
jgi:predicted lipid-binding transport protein (Tim44 family)